ncbi:LacI family DNA-binding transcriptional regulator [Clostridium sp. DL1XJH146]
MKIKMKDIAEVAGVSITTVSRVLNGNRKQPASQETVDNIWKIVKEMGYIPNKSARNLVKGSEEEDVIANKIGCVFTSTFDLNNDPFFSCIGLGIQHELNKTAYNLAFTLQAGNMKYDEIYKYITKYDVDGIILMGSIDYSTLDMIKGAVEHIVYAGVNGVEDSFDEVICNGYDGATAAIGHLIDMGHNKIGYVGITSRNKKMINENRYKAYCDVLQKNNMPIDVDYVVSTELKTTLAYNNMKEYLSNKNKEKLPTALFCGNDAVAFGVMKALKEEGFNIPEDIAIIGFDNVEMTQFVTPPLSSVAVPRKKLGEQAVKMLIERIENKRDYSMKVNLPYKLILRESSDYYRND